MDQRHRPAVSPHTKSKSSHLPRRHDHSEDVRQQDLHAIASSYLLKWIKHNSFVVGSVSGEDEVGDNERSNFFSSCNGYVAHDNSALAPSPRSPLPHTASFSRKYPLKQLWTRHVAPPARATDHETNGRNENDEHIIATCPPRRNQSVGLYTGNEDSSTPSNSKDETHRVDSMMMRSTEEKKGVKVQNGAGRVSTKNNRCDTSPFTSSFSTVRSDLSQQLSPQLWQQQQQQNRQRTYLPHLKLGDRGSPQDMLHVKHDGTSLAPSSDCDDDDDENIKFTKAMDLMQVHDFAFVRRSDGVSWTYAIVADRRHDSILFVVDTEGSTKVLSKRLWRDSISFVNPERDPVVTSRRLKTREMRTGNRSKVSRASSGGRA